MSSRRVGLRPRPGPTIRPGRLEALTPSCRVVFFRNGLMPPNEPGPSSTKSIRRAVAWSDRAARPALVTWLLLLFYFLFLFSFFCFFQYFFLIHKLCAQLVLME
jgi:hypothetical protein